MLARTEETPEIAAHAAHDVFQEVSLPIMRPGSLQVFDHALPLGLYQALKSTSENIGWKFGWRTMTNPLSHYWHHEVGYGDKDNVVDVSEKVRAHQEQVFSDYQDWLRVQLLPPGTQILRFYLNAHTYGTDGWHHYDSHRSNETTLILYLNDEWKLEWGGETVIFRENGDIEKAVLPSKNRIFSFPSCRLHAPRPVAKSFDGLRVVLVVKVALAPGEASASGKATKSSALAANLAYLREIGSGGVAHSGRTLLAHLYGTYRLLASRGADDELCAAALFHSVYGTSKMRCTLTLDREVVRARIGERAERLAWLFCVLHRPACWSVAGNTLPLFAGGHIHVSDTDLADLKTLEQANIDEQDLGRNERANGLQTR